ncbi:MULTISPECIES: efflux RND transporter periplasmic adaptor subunit [Roseivirga]|uniref:efflux RND transporter periplasmic adaptor subunit n=1 Tax=Roseivirga TaxID=290180 RepID=UPI00257DC79A|nr:MULTISPECIES: efflux RND transporter periplasmic adaptor subunit [Roseivirga]MEC7754377.1 efflux RND transporter periplasmic adaptor subunit [Bacteroidota bacterium]|tara:strand:- start:22868 stop:23944 length:1077 start_codon:yes stop_codon:yes gene_type:complete
MSKVSRIAVILVIILAVAAWAVYPRLDEITGSESQVAPVAARGGGALPVNISVAKPKYIENKIKITGSILPNESIELKSEVSGLVMKIHFQEGQRVKKGDLLISLKDDELRAQLEKLRYSNQLARETEARQQKLLQKEAISQEEYDIALTNLNTTSADIKLVEAQLEKLSIRAPFDGVLGLRQISEGAYITNGTVITNLYNLNPMKVDFAIPGKYAGKVQKGDKINFTTDASNKIFEGEVYAIEPRIDETTRTLKLRALADNKDNQLMPGQFAKIELVMESIDNALMVPAVSVIPELNGHRIYLAKGGKAVINNVEIGIRTDEEVQIISGIEPRDSVITSGLLQIRPGAAIQINSVKN